ncbi:MAG TPA: hypothetical protein VFW50_28750 [Streptosporangiaceae bacterium]|nr:hypothetical protein [Streptosporangiaceae bacterium]
MRCVADEPMTAGQLEARTPSCALPPPGCGHARSGRRCRPASSGAGATASARTRSAGSPEALVALVRQLDPGLPDCLPILGAALLSQVPALPPRPDPVDPAGLPLSALLSRALLWFAFEYETRSGAVAGGRRHRAAGAG